MEQLKYPIGKYEPGTTFSPVGEKKWIMALTGQLEEAVSSLSEEQLDTPYRPGGLTVRTLIHPIADSLDPEDLKIKYEHSDRGKETLWRHPGHYFWHGKHHLAHILDLEKRKNWN